MEKKIIENEKTEKEKIREIMNKSLKDSLIFSDEKQIKKPSFSLSLKIKNASNIIKFNYFKRYFKSIYPENTKVKIYNKEYNLRKENEKKDFEIDFQNIIYCSYRKNYPNQKNYKNNIEYNTDCGWGCMIRSGQMIFAKAIYEILIYEKNSNESSLYNSISLFMEYPFNFKDPQPNIFSQYKLKIQDVISKDNTISNKNINQFFPPFSIKIICSVGEILNKTCGEWFSDVNMPFLFKIINKYYNVFNNFKIIPFHTSVIISKLIKQCFLESNNINLKEDDFFLFNDKKYIFKNYGLIFVSVRLGIDSIENLYFNSIRNLFNCKECIGFIGGKNNSASYFIGHDENNILFLDPHYAKNSVIPPLTNEKIQSYIEKTLFQLPFEKLKPAITIGFLFRNLFEFKDLYKYMIENCKKENTIFYIQDNENQINSNLENIDKNETDDF